MDIETIQTQAADLFVAGGDAHDILITAFKEAGNQYPVIAYQTAKVFMVRGDYESSRHALDIALAGWKDDPEQQARAYLVLAHISMVNHDSDSVFHFVEAVTQRTTTTWLVMESGNLLGEVYLYTEPDKALQYFEQSLLFYYRVRHEQHNTADYDIARIATRAADAAFRLNLQDRGEDYLRQAEAAAMRLGNSELIGAMLAAIGEAFERKGLYEQAVDTYNRAIAVPGASKRRIQRSESSRARIELACGNDPQAAFLLTKQTRLDDHTLLCTNTILQGWAAAFRGDFREAEAKLSELELLTRDDKVSACEVSLLRGFVSIYSPTTTPRNLSPLYDVADFFMRYRMEIESSRAHLILAWLLTISDDFINARTAILKAEESLRHLGHARHLARLYEESAPLLGSLWSHEAIELLEHAVEKTLHPTGVRVFAFGAPRVFTRGKRIRQQAPAGKLNIKLLLFMLEKRQAEVDEIIEAVWSDREPQGAANRFYRLSSNLKTAIHERDWMHFDKTRHVYVVRDDFPHFYDADTFNREYDALLQASDQNQSLVHILKLLKIYDTFALTVEGEAFETLRRRYNARYEQVLNRAEELLPLLTQQVPSPFYERVIEQISTGLE